VEIRIARPAGTCYGVDRALRLARQAALDADDGTMVATVGELIHNPQAVKELSREGVGVVASLDEIPPDGTLVVRSHGMTPEVIDAAGNRGLQVVDATCPYVARVQDAAADLRSRGIRVIIIGEPDHPEVRGIRARAGDDALVVTEPSQLPADLNTQKVGVVVQTTQSAAAMEAVVEALRVRVEELRVINTICAATTRRQQAAVALAAAVDVMIVVGGHNSGNTTRLAELSRAVNPLTFSVETPDELQPIWFTNAQIVGVTAGASTPESQLQRVVANIESLPTP
jgi:4-hydroxy-3-methylbut-2-enyl diphosphate reductase